MPPITVNETSSHPSSANNLQQVAGIQTKAGVVSKNNTNTPMFQQQITQQQQKQQLKQAVTAINNVVIAQSQQPQQPPQPQPQQQQQQLEASVILPSLASVLTQIISRNDKLYPFNPEAATVFHSVRAPTVSVHDYLARIVKYANCSAECYVLALIYLDSVVQKNSSLVFTSHNIHRLLITSIMIAAKFLDDIYYNNAFYARVGGVPTNELNALEIKFLSLIEFNLHIKPEVFNRYKSELLSYSAQLSQHQQFQQTPQQLSQQQH